MPQHQETANALKGLREAFAERTGTRARDWHLVFKARYGMREVFRTLREQRGDGAVVTTLFTGCTAVDSITSAGLRPPSTPRRSPSTRRRWRSGRTSAP